MFFIEISFITEQSSYFFSYFLIILGLVGAFLIALFVAKIHKLGLIVIGAAVGLFAGFFINNIFIAHIDSSPPNVD